ncbi:MULTISPECIES: hypothetical protein [unclassified Rhizobium]|uniref:hypothetical protein n=1 Tax=unclassified Rhizobium TaxID=2613769 RepID=UPI0011C3CAEC|nr:MULTISPECIES: hypothetical protein [unclassified Rhizobium]
MIDRIVYFPELTEEDLARSRAVVIACRSDNDQLKRHAALLRAFLDGGGFLVLMGGVRADIVDPRMTFVPTGTNFTWFMQENPDSGHRMGNAGHSLHRYIGLKDLQWHRHGHYLKAGTADTIVELCRPHSEERIGDILFDDRRGFRGRLIATTLDPHMHHGGYYIPAATRFLNGFYPWLRREIEAPMRWASEHLSQEVENSFSRNGGT